MEALLYNPALPINQRISKLSSTIVARMYHSEAILLNDGRVLVSLCHWLSPSVADCRFAMLRRPTANLRVLPRSVRSR